MSESIGSAWLVARGLGGLPGECGIVLTERQRTHPPCAGMEENSVVIGEAAVDVLTGLVERGEFGASMHPQNVLIEGHWSASDRTALSVTES